MTYLDTKVLFDGTGLVARQAFGIGRTGMISTELAGEDREMRMILE